MIAALDALLSGQLIWDLDEGPRLQLHEVRDVLGDVVLVLGEPVAGRDVGKVGGGAESVGPPGRLVVEKSDRRSRIRRVQRVGDR